MDLGIAGRKAIVCASSRGLGRGCAEALAEAGCSVVINGRDAAALDMTAAAIRQRTGADVTAVVADVSTPEGQKLLLAACPEPDILVNNNGGPPYRNFRELDREAMIAGVVQNMVTPIELIQAVVGGMMERGFGRIVDITSASVRTPISGLDLSSGARAGLTAFLAGVAREVAPHGVTINHILPGIFDTDRLKAGFARAAAVRGASVDAVKAERMAEVPVGRLGTPEEFGKLCAFLCSVHAGYITGQSILIDGGAFRTTV
ncbi:SDR family oxidoreductase [Chelatococcus sp. SYSU_G07232]|uniref:SDR family oxidoreductase n=1 Tax=Chelatococcus albus TaxID=3047466 RepID=A0ABT7AGL0_9HYPH|nr:SDR family oxidoreductase [Chelatococcus sp. SYSU_G07232]MDJ1158506.1 SDR family oxidoreductase [Chelatococcus sp. SYSU_G07232]